MIGIGDFWGWKQYVGFEKPRLCCSTHFYEIEAYQAYHMIVR